MGVIRIGRGIVIRPTWRRHRRLPGDTVIAMDPGMAFGTGLHPTTRLCLAGIERWADDGRLSRGRSRGGAARVLDVGCGSGILAIAAALLGAGELVGVDSDPIAVEATLANARRNRVARRLRAGGLAPDGPGRSTSREPLASLLVALAADLRPSCARAAVCWRPASSSTGRPTSGPPSRPPAWDRRPRRRGRLVALEAERPGQVPGSGGLR